MYDLINISIKTTINLFSSFLHIGTVNYPHYSWFIRFLLTCKDMVVA